MSYFINRELSWLKFNQRVLEEANAPTVPDFEKLKFISIFTSNLDEFFMVRAGSMYDRSLLAESVPDNKTGMSAKEQLDAIYRDARPLYGLRDQYFADVREKLDANGFRHMNLKALSPAQTKFVKQHFKREILPLVSPQIIDTKHPFPHLENKKMYVLVSLKNNGKSSHGIIPISNIFRRIVFLPQEEEETGVSYLLAEDIILKYVGDIFKMYTIQARALVKVTRNADVEVEDNFADEDIDYRDYVKIIIKKREKLAPVRLEAYFGIHARSAKLIKYMMERLGLNEAQCFDSTAPLDMSYVYPLEEKLIAVFGHRSALLYQPLAPQPQRDVSPFRPVTETAEKRDIFLSYPYYSMKPYLRLLEEAADDPDTVSIKITLYRLSSNSEVINLLCKAAENGKEVTTVLELKARFDETNNINWSRRLEEAGCRIIYGIDGLKIHSKITLITRRVGDEIRSVTHLATGNYNEKTAKIYTDVGIITTDSAICSDAASFFQNITLGLDQDEYKCLLVAPNSLKNNVIKLIRSEAEKGADGYLRFKMNSITDKEIIEEIVSASQAGVRVDLIIRGICCLLPGIPDVTDNIHIYSIVGRFLEHSRIFIFGRGAERRVYIGSADFMTRNTSRRIEILTPIYDKSIAAELAAMTDDMLRDNVKRSVLCSNGEYERVLTGGEPFDSQLHFYMQAYGEE